MVLARYVTERELQANVVRLARLMGWKVQTTWSSLHSPAGWPDIFATRDGRAIAAELKREMGRTTPAQDDWLAALRAVPGIDVYIWRPSDWASGAIEATLKGTA